MRRLDGLSAFLLYCEGPRSYQHTLKISVLDGWGTAEGLGYAEMLDQIDSNMGAMPYLRWKLAFPPLGINHPYWVQDLDFNLSNHVTRIACPAPGDKKAFCELVSHLYATPLDKSLPLWKLWIVEGLEDNRVAYVTMLHHAYTDGVGFSHVLKALLSTGHPPAITSEELGVNPQRNPGRLWMFVHSLMGLPVMMLRAIPRLITGKLKMRRINKSFRESGKSLPPDPQDAPSSPFNTILTAGRTFNYEAFPLADFKSVCDFHQVTVNELLLGVVTGAARAFHREHGASMEKPLVVSIPISRRTEANKDDILGNFVTSSYVSLPIHIEDPLERLAYIRKSSQAMKEHVKATEGIGFLDAVSIMPPAATDLMKWQAWRNGGKMGFLGNLAISNVAGPTEYITIPGQDARVIDWLSIGQVGFNQGLNITAWRYVDKLNVCIMADASVIPDGEVFMSLLAEGFREYAVH